MVAIISQVKARLKEAIHRAFVSDTSSHLGLSSVTPEKIRKIITNSKLRKRLWNAELMGLHTQHVFFVKVNNRFLFSGEPRQLRLSI